ncbi:macro domain-containing protein [Catellatospora methionotrophica]|uniref:macro domain-containing protein n=1 Tax=Catellatospora methionotrophica TaxID=121620 RepID=UPI0014079E23|nr:macro domain-containing protein [Catellatospora methionotrophica]
MTTLIAVVGDITKQAVDAVVNTASNAVIGGGGGGVNGAIHRLGGPAILHDCITRFPNGLLTGDAAWTTAGNLPAKWVIHTVGPDYTAGQRDRSVLESCYRRALEVADDLGLRTVAFPLIGSGAYGWPRHDAISAAVATIATAATRADEVRLVVTDEDVLEEVRRALARSTPLRILQGVQTLHQRGYHSVRVLPGMSASGMYWRVAVAAPDNFVSEHGYLHVRNEKQAVCYTTGALTAFAGGEVTVTTAPDVVADLILGALPTIAVTHDDPAYVAWFAGLMQLVEKHNAPPIAYADYFDDTEGWEVGWGSGIRHPRPPASPSHQTR